MHWTERLFRYVSRASLSRLGFNYKNRASTEHLPPLMPSPVRLRPLIVVSWSPGYEPVEARQHRLVSSHLRSGRPSERGQAVFSQFVAKFITRLGKIKKVKIELCFDEKTRRAEWRIVRRSSYYNVFISSLYVVEDAFARNNLSPSKPLMEDPVLYQKARRALHLQHLTAILFIKSVISAPIL